MEIGLFQLENLVVSRNIFVFIDLRAESSDTPKELTKLFAMARKAAPAEVEKHLERIQHDKERPLVLVCQDGVTAAAVSARLERAGYSNVYVVAGGVDGLLSEL